MRWISLALVVAAVGCGGDPTAPDNPLAGGVLATFSVVGETFHVWTDHAGTINQILALRDGMSQASIPNGRLRRGPGIGDHNAPYSWHLDPEELAMAEFTIEVCSGLPSFVEGNVDEWIDVVGQYCPWSAVLTDVTDFR